MNTMNELRAFLLDRLDRGSTQTDIARAAAVQQSSLSRFLKNGEGLSAENFLKLLDWAGWSVQRTAAVQNVRLMDGCPPPDPGDYLAVPVVEEALAGPGPVPPDRLKSWFLADRRRMAAQSVRDLLAVELGGPSTFLRPALRSGDIALVDRRDRDLTRPGRLMLVLTPEEAGAIRRVATEKRMGDVRIIYYADNPADHGPEVYSLREDFAGDWEKSVVGRVIGAWSAVRDS